MPVSKVKKVDSSQSGEAKIVVTAQQSRFHELDDSALKDIDIKDLSITVGKREILSHTRLVLKSGLRYVFVGRNGTGKSTLLKALAERKVPGIATNIRMLLLDQSIIETAQKDRVGLPAEQRQQTVIDHVVASDKLRQRLLNDSEILSKVLQDGTGDAEQIVKVYQQLKLEESQRELEEARLVAQHRSGARGARARQVQLDREASVADAEKV